MWPGLLATLLSTIAGTIFFYQTPHATEEYERFRLVIASQITVCTFVSFICGALRGSEAETARSTDQERATTNQLNSLLDSITDAFFATDRDLRLLRFNQAAVAAWDLKPLDLGHLLPDCFPPDTYEALDVPLRRSLELAQPTTLEFYDRQRQRWLEVRVFPSPDGLFVYFHDISERMAHEDELARLALSQEKITALLDSLLAHAPIGFAFFDREYRYERINEILANINGLTPEEHMGKSIRDVVPSTAAAVEPIIDRIFTTGIAEDEIEIEGETLNTPGHRHWLTGFYPVLDKGGEVKSVGAIVLEITQRKLVEERLRESEERFRMMADHAPVMIWVCNPDSTANWFNKPWLEFRQKDLGDALNEGCFSNLHPDDENRVQEKYQEAFEKRERFSVEYRTLDSSGEYRWVLAHGSPLVRSDNQLEHYIVSCVDVTDRKTADENIRQVLANERTARSDAERASRLKDEFVATLSHELRTPLTTMLGWTEILRRSTASEKDIKDGLDAIERSTRLQMQLISDLLDMSRISSGKVRLRLEYADLFDLVESAVDIVRPTATAKGVQLFLSGGTAPTVVRVDPDRFIQVIWNLLTNAIKFTPSGGKVDAGVAVEGGTASVWVRDTGEGINAEFLPHVFDRFRQADGTVTRKHGGLGLGLSIAKQLAELHGGSIEVYSEGLGNGSTFTIRIPVASGMEVPSAEGEEDETPVQDVHPLKDLCVLLVEDDVASRDLLRRILETGGAVVIPADSATIARKLLRETKPDVMISDIGMPDEDGYQLMRSIRALPLSEQGMIPAVALTAFAGEGDRKQALEAGFQLHLTKPVESDSLIRAVKQLAEIGIRKKI